MDYWKGSLLDQQTDVTMGGRRLLQRDRYPVCEEFPKHKGEIVS